MKLLTCTCLCLLLTYAAPVIADDGAFSVSYEIDPQGRRVGKFLNGKFQKGWLYHSNYQIAAELNSGYQVTSHFVYATKKNVPDYFVKGGVNYRIISDHLGSVRLVVNSATGAIVQRMDYDPFGVVLSDTNPGFQPFGFAGGLYDTDTKLYHFGARDYDPETGRWLTKDPIDFDGGDTNLYGYNIDDPINHTDRKGLAPDNWDMGMTGYSDPNAFALAAQNDAFLRSQPTTGELLGNALDSPLAGALLSGGALFSALAGAKPIAYACAGLNGVRDARKAYRDPRSPEGWRGLAYGEGSLLAGEPYGLIFDGKAFMDNWRELADEYFSPGDEGGH